MLHATMVDESMNRCCGQEEDGVGNFLLSIFCWNVREKSILDNTSLYID
jgi:hypothetical protein